MPTKQTNRSSEPAQPTYIAYHVIEGTEGRKARWNRLGAFFAHRDGDGGTLLLEALPIAFDGRVILRAPKAE